MKPDWDKLMGEFKDSKTALVADVDCTAGGKSLCDQVGVRGYPTIKYGDPNNLEDYKGGRSFDQLKKFAEENLGPTCGPNNLDLCDDEKKATIAKYQAMSADELDKFIKEQDDAITKAEADFKSFVEGLQKQYETKSKEKDDIVNGVKGGGLGMAKAVKAAASKSGKTDL
jgi:hypothetical protein